MRLFAEATRHLPGSMPYLTADGLSILCMIAALALVLWQYRRVAAWEAAHLGAVKNHPLLRTLESIALGLTGGVLVSLGGERAVAAAVYLWPLSLGLGLLGQRFLNPTYGATALAIGGLALGWGGVDVKAVLLLAASLRLAEALLTAAGGSLCTTPVTIHGRNTTAVAAFRLHGFWPVPLMLFSGTGGWSLLPAAFVLSYADLAVADLPQQRVRRAAIVAGAHGLALLILVLGADYWPWLLWAAALVCAPGHEAFARWSRRVQLARLPLWEPPHRGVQVLDVLPGSPAAIAGIRSGSVILSVDDDAVGSRADLHHALLRSPTYVRILFHNHHRLEQCRVRRPPDGLAGFGVVLLPEPGDQAQAD